MARRLGKWGTGTDQPQRVARQGPRTRPSASNIQPVGTKAWPALPPATTEARYFALLDEANSRSNTPTSTRHTRQADRDTAHEQPLLDETLNTGYLGTFFEQLGTLGRGGSGSVVKVQHVMQGEKLGIYALKKVAVGDSTASLLRTLREVHLLESVQHANIVTYHHAWVENSQLSPYSPSVPTLHILMQYANGGSLDSFINRRRGFTSDSDREQNDSSVSPAKRKERFRMRKLGAVHLLRLDEILDLFEDITHGLAFLHSRNILHLDLKRNPFAEGGSGTLAYLAPETWELDKKSGKLRSADRAVDQWALGLILHLLAFFALPYHNEHDMLLLEKEIQVYRGFFPEDASWLDHGTRHDLPLSLLRLVSKLVNRNAGTRPSAEKVLLEIARMRDDMLMSRFELPLNTQSTALVRVGSPTIESRKDSQIFKEETVIGNSELSQYEHKPYMSAEQNYPCEQHCDEGFTMSPWWKTCVANCGPNNGWRNPWTGKCSGSNDNQKQQQQYQQADTSSSISLATSQDGYESADLSHVGNFAGDNGNAIVSWFDTNSAQDNTNGNSWCLFPYSSETPGVAIKYSTMLNAAGGDENWARQIFCGLEMDVYANGKTTKVVVADAFSDEWVRTDSSLDVVHNSFTNMLGWYTSNKNDVIQGASWKFTGRRSTQYKFGGRGSA
ncbi:putative serine/threonine-protein kinase iks1 [Microbotryomycetes sp. JL201]|nr:putative serine/threonine-protein kinase iks1 [Microbotryomycetes sp. JL201]